MSQSNESKDNYNVYFDVYNNCSDKITDVKVEHEASGHTPMIISADEMDIHFTTPKSQFHTDTSSKDKWTLHFTRKGNVYSGSCNCGCEWDDRDGTVSISFHDTHYNIDLPVTSSCTNKSYS